jgi:hypothetical protein
MYVSRIKPQTKPYAFLCWFTDRMGEQLLDICFTTGHHMSYTATWHTEKSIVHLRYVDSVDFNEIRASNHAVDDLITHGQKPVHVVIDVLDLKEYPRNVFQIQREATYFFNPNIGHIAVLTQNVLMRMMARVIIAISPVEFQIFATLDEALHYFHAKK